LQGELWSLVGENRFKEVWPNLIGVMTSLRV